MNSIVELLRELGAPSLVILLIVVLLALIKYAFSIFKTLPHAVDTMKKIKASSPEEIKGGLDALHEIELALNNGCLAERAYAKMQKKRMAAKYAKDVVRFWPSLQVINLITILVSAALSLLSWFFIDQFSETIETMNSANIELNITDQVYSLLLCFCCMIFFLFSLYATVCLFLGISSLNPKVTKECKNFWKSSQKAGYALYLNAAENLIEDVGKYYLIDCRNDEERLDMPLKNSIPLSEFWQLANLKEKNNENDCSKDVEQLDSRLSFEGPIFVCSYTGKDSYNAVVELKNSGFEKVFDIGGVVKNVNEYQRFAFRIYFLYGVE